MGFMSRMKLGVALASTLVVGTALTGCGGGETGAAGNGSSEGGDSKGSIVLVHDQPAGDGSVIDSQLSGLKTVGEELGYKTSDVFISDPANYQSTLQNVVSTEPTIVVTSFPRITDAFNEVAGANPDIKFIHLYADPVDPAVKNLLTVSYDYYQTMYLSGVFAATYSTSGKVAWVGGDTAPLALADWNAFKAGAQSVSPSITVTPAFVGSYSDTAKAQDVANQLYGTGVDVIQTDAGGADAGVIAAAQQGSGRFVLTGGTASFESAPDVALGAAVADFGASVEETVKKAAASDFTGGELKTGLGDVIKFEPNPTAPTSADATRFQTATTATETAATDAQSGKVTIPFSTTAP